MAEPVREPRLKPTVPPPDQDARWIYSSGSPSRQAPASPAAPKRGPTVTLSSLVLAQCDSVPEATANTAGVCDAFSPKRAAGDGKSGGGGRGVGARGRVGRGKGDGEDERGDADRNVEGTPLRSPADASSVERLAVDASPAVGTSPANRQARCREARGSGQQSIMRRCSSTAEARLRARNHASKKALRGCGTEGRGVGYDLSLRPHWSPTQAAKDRKMGPGIGFGSSGGSHLSTSSPSVSPWCRQAASPPEWGVSAGELLDGQDRGVVGWADDTSGSNA